MNLSSHRRQRALLGIALAFFIIGCLAAAAQKPVSIPEEIEWTWEVRPPHPDPKLPNVLLLGDSLSRNYFPEVTKDLAGVANVYLMASSISVGDPRLPREIREFVAMENVTFRVVHFNNGMHGWGYTEAQYKAAFPQFLRSVRALVAGNSDLVWATITPVEPKAFNGATNDRVDARNAIAKSFIDAAHIPIDDQHALMSQHRDLYQDTVHFNTAGSKLMGDQAASTIRTQLRK
ncbi:MAG TPA: SGNH/GDSL hydrolase family protein [Acidobacteriaceae bacterium]|jgi:lysophospholipase L1-like esterase